MTVIHLTLDKPVERACELIIGVPVDTPEQRFLGADIKGAASANEITAGNSGQTALCISAAAGASPEVTFTFTEEAGAFPVWALMPTGGPHERPSEELTLLISEIAPLSLDPAERVERIVRHVEARFRYGVRNIGLGDDLDAMPALACDTHLGTCVDTHSYAVAAMRAGGIAAAYVSGVFFSEGETVSAPGHCWFVVSVDGAPHHWDISHFLKYGLGPVRPVLNPKPGFRFAMSIGRDLTFEGRDGPVNFSRLSGFNVLSGPERGAKLGTRAEALKTMSSAA